MMDSQEEAEFRCSECCKSDGSRSTRSRSGRSWVRPATLSKAKVKGSKAFKVRKAKKADS